MAGEKLIDKITFAFSVLMLFLFIFWILYTAEPFSAEFWKIIILISLFSSAYIMKNFPEIREGARNFSQKDLLLFSVVYIYFLLTIFVKIAFIFYNGYNGILFCSSNLCYLGYMTIVLGLIATIILVPFLARIIAQFILMILALVNSKEIRIIKSLFFLDIMAQKFYNTRDFYIFEKGKPGLWQFEKGRKIAEEEEKISRISEENMSYLYESQKDNVFILIFYFFLANMILATQELSKINTNGVFDLSIFKIFGIITVLIVANRMFIFIASFNKDYFPKLFLQKSHFDGLFLIIIILIFMGNSLFSLFTFLELFWILYLFSYLSDIILSRVAKE